MTIAAEPDALTRQTPPAHSAQSLDSTASTIRSIWMWAFPVALALAACAAATGWFVDGFYAENGATLEAKGRYGDLVIIILVPLGLGAFAFERARHLWARPVVLGLAVHFGFMYGVLAFDYQENVLFIVYSAMVGLCLFLGATGLTAFARSVDRSSPTPTIHLASLALLLAVVTGYGFWVSDVVNALLDDTTAESLSGTDLPANAARVIDMAIALPLTGIGAVRLWRGRGDGLAISAVMSTYLVLITATVTVMEMGLANTTDLDLDIGKIAGYSFTTSLGLVAAVVTYRELGRQAARKRSAQRTSMALHQV